MSADLRSKRAMPRTRSGRWLWQGCLSAGFCLALIPAAAAQDHRASPANDPPAPGVEVEIARGLLTLHTDGAPLAEVLQAIGAAGGLEVVLRGGFARPVRASFTDRPLEDAVRGLAAGHSVLIVHEAPASGATPPARIAVIENRSAVRAESGQAPASVAAEVRPDDAGVATVRPAAAPKASSPGPREALETLSRVLANDGAATVRSRAVAALTRLELPGARRLLRERALGDDDHRLRMQSLRTLAHAQGQRAINVFAQALHEDPEPKVRMTAIRALLRIGGDWGRRQIERAVADLDPRTAAAAERALAAWPESSG